MKQHSTTILVVLILFLSFVSNNVWASEFERGTLSPGGKRTFPLSTEEGQYINVQFLTAKGEVTVYAKNDYDKGLETVLSKNNNTYMFQFPYTSDTYKKYGGVVTELHNPRAENLDFVYSIVGYNDVTIVAIIIASPIICCCCLFFLCVVGCIASCVCCGACNTSSKTHYVHVPQPQYGNSTYQSQYQGGGYQNFGASQNQATVPYYSQQQQQQPSMYPPV